MNEIVIVQYNVHQHKQIISTLVHVAHITVMYGLFTFYSFFSTNQQDLVLLLFTLEPPRFG